MPIVNTRDATFTAVQACRESKQDLLKGLLLARRNRAAIAVMFTSPRLRGEVGSHRQMRSG
jgi:hypothetical protein